MKEEIEELKKRMGILEKRQELIARVITRHHPLERQFQDDAVERKAGGKR